MKTKLLLLFSISIILTGCMYNGINDTDSSHKLKAGNTAYQYTQRNLLYFTDIITYARMFREYIRQTTIAGRDSVNSIYFANTNIAKSKDPMHQTDIYNITIRDQFDKINYVISVYNPAAPTWKIQATANTNGETIIYNLNINNVYTNKWTVSESSCTPKAQLYSSSETISTGNNSYNEDDYYFLYQQAFSVKNQPLIVQWDNEQLYPHFELSGSGTLESHATPKLKIGYTIDQPITVYSYPGYETIHYNNRDFDFVHHFTAYHTGSLQLTVNDTIDQSIDKYTVTLRHQHLCIETDNIKEEFYRH